MIDLHCHSLASDGSYSPKELIKMAENLNITHLALTDHDTTAGIKDKNTRNRNKCRKRKRRAAYCRSFY